MVLSKIHWLFKIVPGTILFFYPMIDKAIYVDNFIHYATNNKYFGAYQVIINDLIIYLVIILFVYISFLKYIPNYFSILIRITSLILYSLYITDYLILLNFNTHLTLSDIFKYIAIAPRYFLQAFIDFNLRTIILFACCTFLIISFIIHKWRLQYKLFNHLVTLFMTLGFICLVSYLPKDNYVHSWLYKNFIEYNLTISSEAKEYSSEFINNFEYHEEHFFSKNIKATPNIILLMVESISSYQSKFFSGIRDWTPSLDSIAINNVAYKNFHANGFCSEDGENAMLLGKLPLTNPGSFTQGGRAKDLTLGDSILNHSLPKRLKRQGYHTEYLAPFDLGYRDAEKWAYEIGFDYVEGQENKFYDKLPRYQFNGVEDKALYQRVIKRIKSNKLSKPYFLFLSTVSSHHPFTHPQSGSKSESEIFKYVDEQIGKFYRQLEKNNFFDNGILLIVSDHHSMVPLKKEEVEKFGYARAPAMIPLVVASSNINPKIVTSHHQQIDIYNSLAQINLDSVRFSKWEGSIFAENIHRDQFSIHKRGDNRNIISVFTGNKDYEVKLDGDNTQIVSGDLSSKIINTEILNKINWERIKYLKAD